MRARLDMQFLNNSLICPSGRSQIEFTDEGGVRGMYVLVSAANPGQGTYYLRYKDNTGKTCHQKIGRTSDITLAEARKKAKTLKSEINLGADPRAEAKARKEVPTFDQLWEQYESYAKPRLRSFDRYEQLYRIRIKGKFGKMRLNQISRHMVQLFHTELLAEGLAPATCDHHLKLMKHMFNLAHDWSLFDGPNPVSRAKMANADNKVEHYLDHAELERLLTVLRTDENRPVCLIAMYLLSTGARLNEALSAKWCNVDIDNRVWRIPASNSKSKHIRSVPLNDSALDVLKQLDTKGQFEYLFINKQTGQPYTTIMKVWTRLRNKAGLPHLRAHDLRHNFSSMLVSSGRTLYELQRILGHANPVTSQRYGHISSAALQDASNSASKIIMGAMESSMQQRIQAVAVETVPALASPALAQIKLAPPELAEAKAA